MGWRLEARIGVLIGAIIRAMNNEDLAWAAGFIDGEGHFGIANKERMTPQIYLSAGQCDRRVLDRLQAILGGKVYGPYKQKKAGHNDYHYWRLGSQETKVAAERLWPWLSEVKKEQFGRSANGVAQRLENGNGRKANAGSTPAPSA